MNPSLSKQTKNCWVGSNLPKSLISQNIDPCLGSLRHLHWPEGPLRPVFEAGGVRAMGSHHGVEGGTAGAESLLLGLVLPQDQAHELGHAVTVVVRWPECLLS